MLQILLFVCIFVLVHSRALATHEEKQYPSVTTVTDFDAEGEEEGEDPRLLRAPHIAPDHGVYIAPWHRLCGTGGHIPRTRKIIPHDFFCVSHAHSRGINGTNVRVGIFDQSVDTGRGSVQVAGHWPPGVGLRDVFNVKRELTSHATRVASFFIADNEQCPGLAFGSKVYSYKIHKEERLDEDLLRGAVAAALLVPIDIAVFPNGCDSQAWDDGQCSEPALALLREMVDALTSAGVVVFAAAGGVDYAKLHDSGYEDDGSGYYDWRDARVYPASFPKVHSVGCIYSDYAPANQFYPFSTRMDAGQGPRPEPDTCTQCHFLVASTMGGVCLMSDFGGSSDAVAVIAALYALQLSAERIGIPLLDPNICYVRSFEKRAAIQRRGCGHLSPDLIVGNYRDNVGLYRQMRRVFFPEDDVWNEVRMRADLESEEAFISKALSEAQPYYAKAREYASPCSSEQSRIM
jgi:hypothetical protein